MQITPTTANCPICRSKMKTSVLYKTGFFDVWVSAKDAYVFKNNSVKRHDKSDLPGILGSSHIFGFKLAGQELAYTASGEATPYFLDLFEDVPIMAGHLGPARRMRREAVKRFNTELTGFYAASGEENVFDFLLGSAFPCVASN